MKKKTNLDDLSLIMQRVSESDIEKARIIEKEIRFLLESMEKLKAEIEKVGVTCLTENYGQKFIKTNPALDSYNKLATTLQKYLTALYDLTEVKVNEEEGNEFFQ